MEATLIEVRDGKLLWKGVFKDPVEIAAILAEIQAAGQSHPYYRDIAAELAKRLEKAMRAAGYVKESEAA